jgi:serine/threonine-protein kinase
LCRRGGVPDCVKVLDFGLVRDFRADKVAENGAVNDLVEGTPWFMPPESIQSTTSGDPRSDIYSLGALAYYLLTGQYIFEAANISEVYNKQVKEPPIPPSQRGVQAISAEMEALVLCCLEKDPARRPQSAAWLRTRLLATPLAAEWNLAARTAWWDNYEQQPAVDEAAAPDSTKLPTVSVDLASRMEQQS